MIIRDYGFVEIGFTDLRASCDARLRGSGCAVHGPDGRGDGSRTSVYPGAQGRARDLRPFGAKHHGIIRRVGVPGAFFYITYKSILRSIDKIIRTSLFSRGKFPGFSLAMSLGVR